MEYLDKKAHVVKREQKETVDQLAKEVEKETEEIKVNRVYQDLMHHVR